MDRAGRDGPSTRRPEPYLVRTVVSKDGTSIGYRRFGRGPGLVLLHGGLMAAQNFTRLATALSAEFTVYVPDRRGRGVSGPAGDYSLQKEVDDLAALLTGTGAHYLFGLSSGAVVALQATLALPDIHRLAVYEPPLSVDDSYSPDWVTRYDEEVAQGRLGAAMVTVMKGTRDQLGALPRWVLAPLMTLAVQAEAKRAGDDRVALRDLIPTMHYDAQAVAEAAGLVERCAGLPTEVLLMGGSKSPRYLKTALDALATALPHATRVQLAGADHMAADDGGKPELVAQRLREFFRKSNRPVEHPNPPGNLRVLTHPTAATRAPSPSPHRPAEGGPTAGLSDQTRSSLAGRTTKDKDANGWTTGQG